MSMQVSYARSRAMGDPGLFGFLGSVAKGVTGIASKILPGPVGAVAGGINTLLGGGRRTGVRAMPGSGATTDPRIFQGPMVYSRGITPSVQPSQPISAGLPISLPSGIERKVQEVKRRLGIGPTVNGTDVAPYRPPQVAMEGLTTPPPGPGYRPNKSGYWRRDPRDLSGQTAIWIPPRSIWVRSRRRNPLNPRAADRAISRLTSAKRAVKKLGRVTIREKACR